jgi:transcriptional regulator with XRE-family HTH domain
MEDMPNRIREQRLGRKWTLEQLAEKVGCSLVQISDLERGRRQLNDNWLKRIAVALDVSVGDLLLERDNSLSLSVHERDMVMRYRAADPATQDKIRQLIDVMTPANGNGKGAAAA